MLNMDSSSGARSLFDILVWICTAGKIVRNVLSIEGRLHAALKALQSPGRARCLVSLGPITTKEDVAKDPHPDFRREAHWVRVRVRVPYLD